MERCPGRRPPAGLSAQRGVCRTPGRTNAAAARRSGAALIALRRTQLPKATLPLFPRGRLRPSLSPLTPGKRRRLMGLKAESGAGRARLHAHERLAPRSPPNQARSSSSWDPCAELAGALRDGWSDRQTWQIKETKGRTHGGTGPAARKGATIFQLGRNTMAIWRDAARYCWFKMDLFISKLYTRPGAGRDRDTLTAVPSVARQTILVAPQLPPCAAGSGPLCTGHSPRTSRQRPETAAHGTACRARLSPVWCPAPPQSASSSY